VDTRVRQTAPRARCWGNERKKRESEVKHYATYLGGKTKSKKRENSKPKRKEPQMVPLARVNQETGNNIQENENGNLDRQGKKKEKKYSPPVQKGKQNTGETAAPRTALGTSL